MSNSIEEGSETHSSGGTTSLSCQLVSLRMGMEGLTLSYKLKALLAWMTPATLTLDRLWILLFFSWHLPVSLSLFCNLFWTTFKTISSFSWSSVGSFFSLQDLLRDIENRENALGYCLFPPSVLNHPGTVDWTHLIFFSNSLRHTNNVLGFLLNLTFSHLCVISIHFILLYAHIRGFAM